VPAGTYGRLDPWAYNVLHRSRQSVPARAPNAFDWGDAGVGASVAVAAVLFAAGVATLIVRRGRGRLAGSDQAVDIEEGGRRDVVARSHPRSGPSSGTAAHQFGWW
jgi:hypothetical protein